MGYTVTVKLITELHTHLGIHDGVEINIANEESLDDALMNGIENAAKIFMNFENRPDSLTFEASGVTEDAKVSFLKVRVTYKPSAWSDGRDKYLIIDQYESNSFRVATPGDKNSLSGSYL